MSDKLVGGIVLGGGGCLVQRQLVEDDPMFRLLSYGWKVVLTGISLGGGGFIFPLVGLDEGLRLGLKMVHPMEVPKGLDPEAVLAAASLALSACAMGVRR
jgi:hypothetical protein